MHKRLSRLLTAASCVASMAAVSASAAGPAAPNGVVKAAIYLSTSGGLAFTNDAKYPNSPDGIWYPKRFEWYSISDTDRPSNLPLAFGAVPSEGGPVESGNGLENFGTRITGWLFPKATDDYQFSIACDDPGELWLSTDDSPANRKLIAWETGWNDKRKFDSTENDGSNPDILVDEGTPDERSIIKSKFIRLTAGSKYYIEAVSKEGGGGDNLAVAWRKRSDPEFEANGQPILGEFLGGEFAAAATLTSQPRNAAALGGSPATFTVGMDIPPSVTLTSIQWSRNGVNIPDGTNATLSVVSTPADDNAKYRATIVTSSGTLVSDEATLNVRTLSNAFAAGVVKVEFFRDITGTSVEALETADKYVNNQPDEVRLLGAIDTPNGYGENYGARVTGFITPAVSGNYTFFVRSDDASEFRLSPNEDPAGVQPIAMETGCCAAFIEEGEETSSPQALVGGQRYAFVYLLKEGGGGDYGQVAWRAENDATAAASLTPLRGISIGANARISSVDWTITQQPTTPISVEVGRPINLTVAATVGPAGFNLPMIIQWQKGGVNIPGANAATYTIPSAVTGDAGTYRAVLTAAGVGTNTVDVVVNVIQDTAGPLITDIGVLKKGANIELGVALDENVDPVSGGLAANWSVSKGTITAVRVVKQSPGVVLVVSGLVAGDVVTVTGTNIKDVNNNTRATTSDTVTIPTKILTWVAVGGDEVPTRIDDALARNEEDFDLVSGSNAHWTNYDEQTFVYEEITGDFDRIVRVEYQDPVTQWSRAGLDAREALDAGKTRADITDGGYLFSQHFNVRVNPPGGMAWDGRLGNNAHETLHRPRAGGFYEQFNPIFNILNGGSVPPPYPNAWLRLKREGQKMLAFRSDNGTTWVGIGDVTYQNDPETEEDETLAATLFVGMFYAPEFGNLQTEEQRLAHPDAAIARFRDYGPMSTEPPIGRPTLVLVHTGNTITLTWPAGAHLEATDSLTTPNWVDVPNAASGLTITLPKEGMRFYRLAVGPQ